MFASRPNQLTWL